MILMLLSFLLAFSGNRPWPYPSRPPDVRIFTDTGVLTSYVLGNHNGGLTIRHSDGTSAHFFVALPNEINGRRYGCQLLPWLGEPASMRDARCETHPAVVVGKTVVHVSYWWGYFEDHRAKISDDISAVTP